MKIFGARFFIFGEHGERAFVCGHRTHFGSEAADGFEVVIENFRARGEHGVDGGIVVQKIRREHFDDDFGIHRAHALDDILKMRRAAIGQIIARHGGDDDVIELHPPRGFGDAFRFVILECLRFAGIHRAEATRARAAIAGDHKSGGAFAPAFPMVRAARTFTNGVEIQVVDEIARGEVCARRWQLQSEPLGQARAFFFDAWRRRSFYFSESLPKDH